MPELEVHLAVAEESDPITYIVDGDLKRPGGAIEDAKELAADDGYDDAELDSVELAEPA